MMIHLSNRGLIHIRGEEAKSFLQNMVTADVEKVTEDHMAFSCLLTPQGQFLYEFFISKHPTDGYYLDCDKSRMPDFLRRLSLYKLRAKVEIHEDRSGIKVYATDNLGLKDERSRGLGCRLYNAQEQVSSSSEEHYHDVCIALGVPDGCRGAKPEKDYLSDLNFDLCGAVSFDKGCFIGQEVAARMHHRGLVKKRLARVSGGHMVAGMRLFQDGVDVGEIRDTDSQNTLSIAVVKLSVIENVSHPVITDTGQIVSVVF